MSEQVQLQNSFQPTIKLHDFEGPLDLLLHLIKQSEMDIYDIEISQITSQYLEYLHQMQSHQLEVAGEYFVMAATLMNIKSQMLLPAPPIMEDEPEVAEVDPRQELVDQLLEYQRYKKAADHLKVKESLRQQEYTRPAMQVPDELVKTSVEPGISLGELQSAFASVLRRHQLASPIVETVSAEKVSVSHQMKEVFAIVRQGSARFDDLFVDLKTRDGLVTTFLAILELAKHQAILINQSGLFDPIILVEGPKSDEYEANQSGTN
ncbi:segregation/condensation protein A [Limosilactobacillus sp. STM2_1]|uniref:Segregation and condensation protein A n=1 Tax=Limosilactobacillus rudii TaxID=2759755 RepID=A0A7W3UJT0_9LACO|nr:segregation/condensation protein A [Limosilactobacillus rudii]MBB1078317.1 segregation/condensation protein A [Limosilactobacillus rudii]MBB1096913.1 segregation/condensation protein A [Limosilactobacillus rudii]MCD7134087.1 segregation/condensation protein A [Limosilactobacillus rudii]